MTVKYFTK
jgi:hypothetical protein